MLAKIGRKILLFVFSLLMILIGMAGVNMLVFFISAETPQEVAQQGHTTIPANWSAGVLWRGGGYMEWYTIPDAPFLFALTMVMVTAFLTFMVVGHWIQAKQRRAKKAAAQAESTEP